MLYCPKCGSESIRKAGYTTNGQQSYRCNDCGARPSKLAGEHHYDSAIPIEITKEKVKHLKNKKRFVITSAQNATPVNPMFKNILDNYCNVNDAELVVIPYRYHNPTSLFYNKDDDWWDGSIVEHLLDSRMGVTDDVSILGDVKIQPTAKNPLTSLETLSKGSAILGHPKVALKSVPSTNFPKIITTTGTITIPNYTHSKAGIQGKHHHSFSAAVLEIDNDIFHIRHIHYKDGCVYDLDKVYYSNKVEQAKNPTIILPDLHQWFVDHNVDKAVFNEIIPTLKPETVIFHDTLDCYSISHHHKNKVFTKLAKHKSGTNSIKNEIDSLITYLKDRKRKDQEFVLVPSNHDDHILRWIEETDWKDELQNAEFYLETALQMVQSTQMTKKGTKYTHPFKLWVNRLFPDLTLLEEDESYIKHDVELGLHGHIGMNGSRGSIASFANIAEKLVIGHAHSPGIRDGVYQVGKMAGKMEYEKGPSGGLHSLCILYANGKRTLIHVIGGKWRS